MSNDLESLLKEFNLVKDLDLCNKSKTFKELYVKQFTHKISNLLGEVDSETLLKIQSELNSQL